MRKGIALLIAASLVSVLQAEPQDPVNLIKTKDKELQRLLKKGKISASPQRQERVKQLINGIFDFHELGRKSLGSKVFKELSDGQQQRFIKAFKEMIENSSLKKLEVYKSDSTVYEEPIGKEDKVKITAHTFYDGQESVLVYKMFLKYGQWKAWDLIIDDLSTYRNYKEQFRRILEDKTIEDLIKLLEEKAEGEKKGEKSSNPAPKQQKAASPQDATPDQKVPQTQK